MELTSVPLAAARRHAEDEFVDEEEEGEEVVVRLTPERLLLYRPFTRVLLRTRGVIRVPDTPSLVSALVSARRFCPG